MRSLKNAYLHYHAPLRFLFGHDSMTFSSKLFLPLCFACATTLSAPPALAQVPDFGGVKIEDSITIYNNTLLLNGAGVSTVGKNKIYVAQMYAKQKFSSLDELMAAPGPKRLVLTALREVDTAPIVKNFNRNLEDGNRADMAKLVPGMVGIGNLFKAKRALAPGEVMTLDWIPIYGFTVYIGGKMQGEAYRQPELYKAAVGVFLGDGNIDPKVKDALLGKG
ncbi:MAG: hypothetical protein CFE44_21155 [Burkholderiales bacterium PBB4]|nr:MAG: hypothetical protein CFE44_21155 [Burkholderiales bacterium PBB4]